MDTEIFDVVFGDSKNYRKEKLTFEVQEQGVHHQRTISYFLESCVS